jgi:HAE1 family hydrophobic/amphiphilic exporter-1
MSKISKFSVKRPVTILMGILIVVILGIISLANLKTDLFPSINLPYAIVSTTYIGASPEEIETAVTKPIESSMATISNIKNINSVSRENVSMVILEFNEDTNMDSVMVEMREKLDLVKSYMPDDVSNPMIMKINPDMMPILEFSVSFKNKDISETSSLLREKIIPILESTEGIATIDLYGAAEDEVHVTLDQTKVKQYQNLGVNFTADMIKGILAGQNLEMPVGYINDNGSKYLVRVGDKFKSIDDIKALPIISSGNLTVTLNDIATVETVNTNSDSYTKVNGNDAIIISVQKQNNYSTTDVVKNLNKKIDDIKDKYPDIELKTIMNQSEYIDFVVGSVSDNLIYGGILAVLILIVFLKDIKPTIVIGLAIPISIMAAFIMIYFFDITLNIVSLGGLALGVGMLVDNAIVVIENIYRLRNEGHSRTESAIKGAKGVAGAITASTLTTIAVFVPIIFLKGWTAEIFKQMALTITFSLIASLIIALSLVPMISSKVFTKDHKVKENKSIEKLKSFYKKSLHYALKHKVITIVTVIALFIGSIIGSLSIGTEFFPASDSGQISITVNMPKGATYEETKKEMDDISSIIQKIDDVDLVAGLISDDILNIMSTSSGDGTIYVLLKENKERSTSKVAQDIRDQLKNRTSEIVVTDDMSDMTMMFGSKVSIEIKGTDLDVLKDIANDVTEIVKSVKGTTEIDNGITEAAPELKVLVDRNKSIARGITNANIYMKLADMINTSYKATSITIDGRELDVNVYSGNEKTVTINDIKGVTVNGNKITNVSTITESEGYGVINRINQTRVVTVTANIKDGENIGIVNSKIKDKLNDYKIPSGYQINISGEQAEIDSSMNSLLYALLLGIVLIYMVMAAQFESLLYPFIIMFTVPLAFTGSFLGLFIMNMPLSIVAFIGIIILMGVVVNNGIVLVDYINQLKDEGMSTNEAVVKAGLVRIRPILMTAITTILGLSTMAIGIGEGAEMIRPMAITVIGGLLFATILTLVVVPVIYAGIDRIKYRNVK